MILEDKLYVDYEKVLFVVCSVYGSYYETNGSNSGR